MALPKRLKDTATAVMLMGAAAMPFGQAAHAGDNDNVRLAANTTTATANTASASVERTYSRKEAYRASTDKIVMLYGEGIRNAHLAANVLNDDGYAAITLAGGKPNTVSVFIGRSRPVDYTQDDLYDGRLISDARRNYKDRIGEPTPPKEEPIVVAALN